MDILGLKINDKSLYTYEQLFDLIWNSRVIKSKAFKLEIEKELSKNGFKPVKSTRESSKDDKRSQSRANDVSGTAGKRKKNSKPSKK